MKGRNWTWFSGFMWGACSIVFVIILATSCVNHAVRGQPGVTPGVPITPDRNPTGGVKSAADLRTFESVPCLGVRKDVQTCETTVGRLAAGTVFEDASRRLFMAVEPGDSFREKNPNMIQYGGNQPPVVPGRVYCLDLRDHTLYLLNADERAKPVVGSEWRIEIAPEQNP